MGNILMVTWAGGGNVDVALGLAAELTRRRHIVRVLGHPLQRAKIEAADFAFQPFVHAPPGLPKSPGVASGAPRASSPTSSPTAASGKMCSPRPRNSDLICS
jgi:hypothetical protein